MPTCTPQACLNAEPPCHDDTCTSAHDGVCDDGSLSHGSGACDAGTDATDCDTAATTTTAHDDDGDWDSNWDSKNHCRASNNDVASNNARLGSCCWRGPDEPFACDSGYRPELDGGDCSWWSGGSGKAMSCKQDSSYTTAARCQEHVAGFCQEQSAGAIAFFFIYMVWELIATVVYAVAACKAAKVPPGTQSSGTQMHSQMQQQHMQHASSAQAMPHVGAVVFATAVAQPVAAVPMSMPHAQAVAMGSPMPHLAQAQAVPMGTAPAVPCSSNPLYSGG